jgi:2-hydroxy-3-oxopropionate reductase
VLGANGILEGARKGSTLIDMSSINPSVSQKIEAACSSKAFRFSTHL